MAVIVRMTPDRLAIIRLAALRAHDEAVGTLMAAHTAAQLARWRADDAMPPLLYVRPRVERNATFRVERMRQYAEDGHEAARDALARWRANP